MSTVDSVEIENISNSLLSIATTLKNDYDTIMSTISQINGEIDTLKSWSGTDVYGESFLYEEVPISDGFLGNFVNKKQYYKYIWDIQVSGDSYVSEVLSGEFLKDIQENIELLNLKGEDLLLLSSTLYGFINTLSSLLSVEYQGDITTFFENIKDNEGWKETKRIAEEARAQKEVDELYLKYRSTDGNDDYVDFLLDELGNRRYPQGLIGIEDDGLSSDRGASKYGEWYINYYTGHEDENTSAVRYMDNDAAFCAAAVTYAMTLSGNEGTIPPFIAVSTGAQQTREMANQGIGTWHSASDTSYQPQRGDIFYKVGGENGNHVGIVLGSDENYIYTIEGNTASDFKDGWSFGTVNTRVRESSYVNTGNSLAGYYSPDVPINNFSTNVSIVQETIDEKLDLNERNN